MLLNKKWSTFGDLDNISRCEDEFYKICTLSTEHYFDINSKSIFVWYYRFYVFFVDWTGAKACNLSIKNKTISPNCVLHLNVTFIYFYKQDHRFKHVRLNLFQKSKTPLLCPQRVQMFPNSVFHDRVPFTSQRISVWNIFLYGICCYRYKFCSQNIICNHFKCINMNRKMNQVRNVENAYKLEPGNIKDEKCHLPKVKRYRINK